jgi:hypothetical protein
MNGLIFPFLKHLLSTYCVRGSMLGHGGWWGRGRTQLCTWGRVSGPWGALRADPGARSLEIPEEGWVGF